jgi:hypothetical protein
MGKPGKREFVQVLRLMEVFKIDTPQILLAHHLKALKLPTFLREMKSSVS